MGLTPLVYSQTSANKLTNTSDATLSQLVNMGNLTPARTTTVTPKSGTDEQFSHSLRTPINKSVPDSHLPQAPSPKPQAPKC